jgi:hypothetical protein
MHVPAIGHTLSRDLMPQIKDPHDFLDELELQGISHATQTLDPHKLKSTQSEFDANKVYAMMSDHGEKRPIITSNDGYVLDGHHRWLEAANKGEKIEGHVCNAGILELLHHAKRYVAQGIGLNEALEAIEQKGGIDHKDFGPMLDSFVSFASNHLGLKSLPNIRLKGAGDNFNSFAAYTPGSKETVVSISNRHPMDVFRSVAHELVHHKQDEDGALYDGAGETGSPIEDEANLMAGRIMRHWAKNNSHHFGLAHIAEAYLIVGGPMSGKDRIARLLNEDGTRVHTMEPYDTAAVEQAYQDLIKEGCSPLVYFIETTNEISKARNEARAERGQRVLAEGVRFEKFTKAQQSKEKLREMFGKDFHVFDNSIQEGKNDVTVKVKVEQPKPAAKKKSSASSSAKPKKKVVKKSQEQIKMDLEAHKHRLASKSEESKQKFSQDSEAAKRQHEVETQAREAKGAHFQQRAAEMEMRIQQIRDTMSRLQPQGTNYKKIHSAMHKQVKGAMLGMRNWQKQAVNTVAGTPKPEPSKGIAKPGMNEAFENMFEEGGAGDWGTDKLRKKYEEDTPGQGSSVEAPDYFKRKFLRKKVAENDVLPTDSIGPGTITNLPPWPYSNGVGIGGYSGLAENVVAWSKKPETAQRYFARYGKDAPDKILETAKAMNEVKAEPRTLKKMKESFDKGVGLMGTVPNQGKDEIEEDDRKHDHRKASHFKLSFKAKGLKPKNKSHK